MKLKFKNPKKSEIVVFDGTSLKDLNYILKKLDFTVVENRRTRIFEIYCGPFFLYKFFLNFFILFFKDRNLHTVYLYTLIKIINPKMIITSIDNSFKFSDLANLLKKKIKFIAIQNANRLDYEKNNYFFKKKLIDENLNIKYYKIPHFFCFGQHEIDLAKKFDLQIENFYKIGSIRLGNFIQHMTNNKLKLDHNKYDLCLISEPMITHRSLYDLDVWSLDEMYHFKGGDENFINVIRYTINYVKKKKLKFIFLKKYIDAKRSKIEFDYYKKYLKLDEFIFLQNNSVEKKNNFDTYFYLLQSKLAIGTRSTLLKDKIGFRQKILSLSIPPEEIYDFPIEGICKLKNYNYSEFEDRLEYLFKITIDEYMAGLEKSPNYVMELNNDLSINDRILHNINLLR